MAYTADVNRWRGPAPQGEEYYQRPHMLDTPLHPGWIAVTILGSYGLIAKIFQWLALALLAYVGAAVLSKPDIGAVIVGTLVENTPPLFPAPPGPPRPFTAAPLPPLPPSARFFLMVGILLTRGFRRGRSD